MNSKTVIITGGTKGIGAAIAEEFYKDDYHVVIGARHDNGFVSSLGPRAKFQQIDARKENDHHKLVTTANKWTGRVDVYINCAGFSAWNPIEKIDNRFLSEMLDVNLKGTFWGCKAAARFMKKGGSIINISSLAGKRGSVNNSAYCASKFGVTGLTQALAKELGNKGIRVNAVCPVYIETPGLMKALKSKVSPTKGQDIDSYFEEFILKQSALGRLPLASEVAKTCLFLASDAASVITGQSINVDCGVLPQ